METQSDTIGELLTNAGQYSKATLELFKLKSVDKTADIASNILSRSLLIIALSLFILTVTIAISFWLGELTGKTYYGFFIVAIAYAVTALVLFLCHPFIKSRVGNSIIARIFNSRIFN